MECTCSVTRSETDASTSCRDLGSDPSDTWSLASSCKTPRGNLSSVSLILYAEVADDVQENLDFFMPRGWSMRRGHLNKLQRPKTGKAALWAEIQGQGQEVSKGRSVFKRSVNNGCRSFHGYRDRRYCPDVQNSKAKRLCTLRHNLKTDVLELNEDYYWQDEWDEEEDVELNEEGEEADWSPVDGWWEQRGVKAPKKPAEMTADESLSCQLKELGAKFDYKTLSADALGRALLPFEVLQKRFLKDFGRRFCKELGRHMGSMEVRPAPVSAAVQSRFLDARSNLGGTLRAAYHGTNIGNLSSIYEKGLLIPGQGNGVRVANGSVHGVGVYTAKLDNPSLSWGFCRAPSLWQRKMMVCGVLDNAYAGKHFAQYRMGFQSVISESQDVRHVGSAMVIFNARRVAPLFEVSCRQGADRKPPAQVDYNWAYHAYLVQRVKDEAVPPRYRRRRALHPKGFCGSRRPRTVEDFARRRAARKRRSSGL
mmetsp:Transcript_111272/g.202371  ORF Transcript_111272/g.202371 Transcript_111272/m.202371 type:complete len:480 (+) Transcript_111272:92-1531(+)